MTYKRYEKYKDSGVNYLGYLPTTWEVKSIKYMINQIQTGTTPSTKNDDYFDGEIQWFTPSDFNIDKELIKSSRTLSELAIKENEAKIFPKDTVVLVGIGATVGKVATLGCKSSFNQQITGLISNKVKLESRYLYYWFFENRETIKSIANYTTLPIINNEFIKNYKVFVPTIDEQKQIASFLDKKTSEIDTLISEKEKLIELLKEKRQAIITEAVTKGLNPNVKMKGSGVELIGEIPEHWSVTSVKRVISKGKEGMKIGPFGSDLKLEEMNESLPFKVYGQENLINDDFNLGRRFITEEKFKEMSAYELFPGDITISMMGTIGKCKVIPKGIVRGIMDSHLIRIRTNKNIIVSEFLQILIDSSYYVYNQLINQSKGSIMNGLNSTIIKNIIIALPNICEQVEILNYVKRKNKEISIIVENIENQTVKLKQYKQSLISEAVTGKIDIRDLSVE